MEKTEEQYIYDKELHELSMLYYIGEKETIDSKREGLVAMKAIPPIEGYSEAEYCKIVHNALNQELDEKYLRPIDALCVLQKAHEKNKDIKMNKIEVNIPQGHESEYLSWKIFQKNGKTFEGEIKVSETSLVKDFYGRDMRREVGGIFYERRFFELPDNVLQKLDFDYHQLKVKIPEIGEVITDLAYAPDQCYQSIDITKEKVRGVSVAMASLRSSENLGIGNFSDLAQFGHIMAQNNMDIISILPIHAKNHRIPESASPYSPISKTFLDFIYIDPTAIQDFKDDNKIQEFYDSPEFETKRRKNQDVWKIDYTTSYELLMPLLKKCYKSFTKNASDERKKEFEDFKKEKGDELKSFATFQSLIEYFSSRETSMPEWTDWPKEFHNPNGETVKSFAQHNKNGIDFFSYVQWQAFSQLDNVQKTLVNAGMKIGLKKDNAVGSISSGHESWSDDKLFSNNKYGVRPDMCSAEGQNWGIIGSSPYQMDKTGYKSFINMMETNMSGGMLRLDCPLYTLHRATLVPEGKTPKEAFCIYMPTDKLMALTTLSSHRKKTPVVFEDLGDVPSFFREKIEQIGGITYKVLPYERCSTRDFPVSSLVVSSTHDSESLNIGWKGESAYILRNQNCIPMGPEHDPDKYVNMYLGDSYKFREHMAGLLKAEGCIDKIDPAKNSNVPEGYYTAVAKLIGNGEHCRSAYGLMPLPDMLGIPHWRDNLPGTPEMHTSVSPNAIGPYNGRDANLPNFNWRLKYPLYLNELAINPRLNEVAAALSNQEVVVDKEPFIRPGRNEEPRRDPERLVKLFTKLAGEEEKRIVEGKEPRFSGMAAFEIWGARTSIKRKKNIERKATQQAEDNISLRENIERYKKQYRRSAEIKKVVFSFSECEK